jgi:hypothetical protein
MRKPGRGAECPGISASRDAEGSRKHYSTGSGTHWGNWQDILLVKNEKHPECHRVEYLLIPKATDFTSIGMRVPPGSREWSRMCIGGLAW